MKSSLAAALFAAALFQPVAYAADADMQMQTHMQEMQELMTAMKEEQDPEKLAALRQQHMEAMHRGMAMMSQSEASMPGMTMENRVQRMEQRMEMMQMMMGQMMDHDQEETERPVHQHKR